MVARVSTVWVAVVMPPRASYCSQPVLLPLCNRRHTHNVYAYLFPVCYVDLGGGEVGNRSHINHFQNNTCIQAQDLASYAGVNCQDNATYPYVPVFGDNTIYNPSGATGMCGFSLKEWQTKGHDLGTTVHKGYPTDAAVIEMAAAILLGKEVNF